MPRGDTPKQARDQENIIALLGRRANRIVLGLIPKATTGHRIVIREPHTLNRSKARLELLGTKRVMTVIQNLGLKKSHFMNCVENGNMRCGSFRMDDGRAKWELKAKTWRLKRPTALWGTDTAIKYTT